MSRNILVVAEHRNAILDNVTWELLCKGREMADQAGSRLAVLLVGTELDALNELLSASGADLVIPVEHALLGDYHAELYTAAIARAAGDFNPGLILMGYTYLGMEIGPALAVRLGGTMVSNCYDLTAQGETLTAVRAMYGATLNARVELSGPQPYIVSFVKGVLPRHPIASRNAPVEAIRIDLGAMPLRSRILEILTINTGGIDITKAKILVSAGRGIGKPENLQLTRDLADALGGELACSRPVADMGWLPFAYQVGISASTVIPDVYIACGISGASQHVTAMRDSGLIVAINKDPNAPIFRVAHYGVVGDVMEVIPALIQLARG